MAALREAPQDQQSASNDLVRCKPHEIERFISKFKTFLKYREQDKYAFINGNMPPRQKRQLQKILDQAKTMVI